MSGYQWATVAAIPAQPGWTVHYVDHDGVHDVVPVVCWITQDELATNRDFETVEAEGGVRPHRRIVAGVLAEGVSVEAADHHDNPWYVSPPGDPGPSAEEITQRGATVKAELHRMTEAVLAGQQRQRAASPP